MAAVIATLIASRSGPSATPTPPTAITSTSASTSIAAAGSPVAPNTQSTTTTSSTISPDLGPITRQQTTDGCHGNADGNRVMGSQLADFLLTTQ